ncbi:PDR/VanB family oxidoreductase [Rhodococcus sp. LB1]|uniref:PDR/VanB family oxidoreductase n=1 Tax=Rhodococcus sp. LB1 TaxID=1807499 RepID=UPI00077AE25D|nr:PDR/VanB family oxidoreductase [Rhodococcus sp. LB1]KXX58966.1 ferredoxin [Rhodococcus sp. LB1]
MTNTHATNLRGTQSGKTFDGLLRVVGRTQEADDVVSLELAAADPDVELPSWDPGAHIDVVLGNGLVRQYSLTGDPAVQSHWRIGILCDAESRGGSKWIHENAQQNTTITGRGPRNNFPLLAAPRYLFLAGGIGITPMLPMIRAAATQGSEWSLHYGGRTRSSMAFLDEITSLKTDSGRVAVHPRDEEGPLDLEALLGIPEPETLVYCCGPTRLIEATERLCREWRPGSLHVERFAATPSITGTETNTTVEVVCDKSGVTLEVPPQLSILEAVENAGLDVMSSCTEGICGSCETRVLSGEPDHRDSLLTDEERESGETMLICVSRALSGRLVLDL